MRWSLRLLLSFALLLALPSAAQPAPAPPTTSPADLQRLLDAVVDTGAPGAIGAVEDGGRTIRRVSGVGNLRTGQPPRPVQTFRVASQTKAFVATVVLQLVAAGKLGLDDPVSRHLPRLLPDGDRITVRQLLNHTSGLFDPQVEVYQTLQDIYDLRLEHWTPRQVVAMATDNGLLFPPGTAWSYSNTNYVVLGLLIERVTGTSVARQLERRLIRPLGLRHTWFPNRTAALPPPRLHGYMPLDLAEPLVDDDITWFNPSFFWASGALVSNVDDLDRFYDALFDGRLLPPPAAGRDADPGRHRRPRRRLRAGAGGLHPALRGGGGRPHRGLHQRPARAVLRHDPGRGQRRRPGQPGDHRRGDPVPVACPVCAPMW